MDDPYKVLGVARNSTTDEIRKAFRNLARKMHPDNGGSAETFDEIKQASKILLDPVKRRAFDEDGIIHDGRPDNTESMALERVANFFISSINATTELRYGVPTLDEIDLVQGATTYFSQQITDLRNHISRVKKQVGQFDKAIARLKTKRTNDVLKDMLTKYSRDLSRNTQHAENEIKINELCKNIVKDYEFVQSDKPSNTINQTLLSPYTGKAFR